ncbi:MAG: hypothetical protein MUP53_09615, partial [Bacteroidales bacterium]|nr:hypothetical protein [Bacteroidales bacterium]
MKNFKYIIPIILVAASSCTSQLYTGAVYDDLYYRASDQPVVAIQANSPERSTEKYYDNIFAGDTLIADEYLPYDEYLAQEGTLGNTSVVNNYYDYMSPSDQIYLFNDSYFYPYWRDPFYYSPFSSRLSFGYNYYGYPFFSGMYDPFGYDSYMYRPYMYDPYYSYSPYYSYWGYGYNPWFSSGWNNNNYYLGNDVNSKYVARREGFSTSSRGTYGNSVDPRNKTASSYTQSLSSTRRTASETVTGAYQRASTVTGGSDQSQVYNR